jgi:hypothetical protein
VVIFHTYVGLPEGMFSEAIRKITGTSSKLVGNETHLLILPMSCGVLLSFSWGELCNIYTALYLLIKYIA